MLPIVHFSSISHFIPPVVLWAPMLSECLCQVMVLQVEQLSDLPMKMSFIMWFSLVLWWHLAQVYVSFETICQDFCRNIFYTRGCKAARVLAFQPLTFRLWELLQGCSSLTDWSNRTVRDVQLTAPFPVVLFALSKVVLQSPFERCSGYPHPPSSWLCIDCAVSRIPKVQPESCFQFPEHLLDVPVT